jgi:capsular polysaccharide export protein
VSFLRLPPFPGHRAGPLVVPGDMGEDPRVLIAALRRERVGGAFWLPPVALGHPIVLAPTNRQEAAAMVAGALARGEAGRCVMLGRWAAGPVARLLRPANPWDIAAQAAEIRAGAGHDLALVAALAGAVLRTMGRGRWAGVEHGLEQAVARGLRGQGRDPFTGAAMTLAQVAALLGAWRRGVEANRGVGGVLGVARWKRASLAPMLWDGGGAVPFGRRGAGRVLGWRARMAGVPDVEVEDGFIRSAGLGAACVPPLSVVVDGAPHIDPARESGLEAVLARAPMDAALLARAAALRARLVAGGIGKYGAGLGAPRRDARRTLLVCGQVEDDRAMLLGGAGVSNLALLRRARAMEPEARILWRPHPDVEAGLRRGAIAPADLAGLADGVERIAPLAALLGQVDAVHVICSLAGFEALLRGVPVVTHGVPFYAGWGLTQDLGPVPARRRRRLTVEALVAGALLLYPRYVDPVTLLPCPAEVVVGRIEQGRARVRGGWGWLVPLRVAWGWVRKRGACAIPGHLAPAGWRRILVRGLSLALRSPLRPPSTSRA